MQTLDAPVYEVNKGSDWYKAKQKSRRNGNDFFKKIKSEYDLGEGFGFYHSECFGVHGGTETYERFKNELRKNPIENDFYPFKKRSKYYVPIKELIEQIEEVSPFKAHDVLGFNNISASQWIGDRWFYGVKNEEYVKGDEVTPINYKEYLEVVVNSID